METHDIEKQLHHFVKSDKYWCSDNYIDNVSSLTYFQKVIKRVNEMEDENESQKKSRMVLVKVEVLRNKIANQSDPRLYWIMFHKIYVIYRDLKYKETLQASLVT